MPRRAEGRRAGRVICCCARAVSGAIVGLLLAWFQYGLMFRPYPPGCYFIQEEVIVSQADDGRLKVTDAPALIHSYVETPGLKVRYENIRAVLKLGEGYNADRADIGNEDEDAVVRYSSWSVRCGIFHNVKITCPIDPNSINSPVKCIVTS